MGKKVTNLKTRMFMEFFSKELGAKFVDENGEEIEWEPIDGCGENEETNK